MSNSSPSGSATSSRKNVPSGAARDPPYQLADRPPERDHVVAVARARHPPRLLAGQEVAHVVPVVHRPRLELARDGGHADRVVEHHRDEGVLFAVRGELGPVLGRRARRGRAGPGRPGCGRTGPWRPSCRSRRRRACRPPMPGRWRGRPRLPRGRRRSGRRRCTHTAAPTSSRSAKLRTSSSRTAAKAGSHTPETSVSVIEPNLRTAPGRRQRDRRTAAMSRSARCVAGRRFWHPKNGSAPKP